MMKIETAMRVTGLKRFFRENTYSAYVLNSWKPEPNLFLHAAKDMGYSPSECLVVEDSDVGIQAGLAAGMRVVHYNPESISISQEPTKTITHMTELLNYLTDIKEI